MRTFIQILITCEKHQAPSTKLIASLWDAGVTVQAHDPESMEEKQRIYVSCDALKLMETKEACLNDADMLGICTEWKQFRTPYFDLIKETISDSVIIEGRNLYNPESIQENGFTYYGIAVVRLLTNLINKDKK